MTPSSPLRRHAAWLCALLLWACAGAAPPPSGPAQPLPGRIWDARAERFVGEPELLRELSRRRYVLLGEVHDNPEHHRIQARVLRELAAAGRRPAVVLEMIPRERAAALDAAQADAAAAPAAIREAVEWDASGWPDWALYAPIFEAALDAGLPLAAGDLERGDRAALRRGGIAALDPERARALGLEQAPPEAVRAVLETSIREGHCDLLPEQAIPAMVEFQRARDAQLARSLTQAAGPDGAVLIAGAGHARRDAGVPVHLARFEPAAGVASVGLVEVDPVEPELPADLRQAFDYVWFTPPEPREDPCEALERRLSAPPDAEPG